MPVLISEPKRYLHAYCIICTDPIYAKSLSDVDHLWWDSLSGGFPICIKCGEDVKHLDNWNYYERIYKKSKIKKPEKKRGLDQWLETSG